MVMIVDKISHRHRHHDDAAALPAHVVEMRGAIVSLRAECTRRLYRILPLFSWSYDATFNG